MKEKIIIQNVLKYENERGKGTRVSFYFNKTDSVANNKNYKGFTENVCFYRDTDIFDKIPLELIGTSVDCILKSVPSTRNPMSSTTLIESITYDGRTIRLLQS